MAVATRNRAAAGDAAHRDRGAKGDRHNSAIVLVRSLEEAIELANRFAPEHLSIPDRNAAGAVHARGQRFHRARTVPKLRATMHPARIMSCPPAALARLRGGLSVCRLCESDLRAGAQRKRRLQQLAPAITTLARAEGLEAHARSVEVRTQCR